MLKKTMLIVEDSPEQLKVYAAYALALGFDVVTAHSEKSAVATLAEKTIDILLTDIHLSPSILIDTFEGHKVIRYAADRCPETLIIAMSNDPRASTYYKTLELGALAYIKKPILNEDEILVALDVARERLAAKDEKAKQQQNSAHLEIKCEDGIVLDPIKRKLASRLAAAKEVPIIINGESGTGKEEYVRLIHKKREQLERTSSPLVVVNCANLDSSLAMSTLFGHAKGAFTGADKTTQGAIGEANGGILFLDEIQFLSYDCQRRLLRVLNDGTYQRLGESKVQKSEFQIIVATTKNLDNMVRDGKFLLDLRMRIAGAEIILEPLRERKHDMTELVALFLAKFRAKVDEAEFAKIVARCQEFYWQGNIRQLYKVIQSLVLTSGLYDEPIKAANIPVSPLMLAPEASEDERVGEIVADVAADVLERLIAPLRKDKDFHEAMSFYESLVIKNCIKRHKNIATACTAINLPRSTFDDKKNRSGL